MSIKNLEDIIPGIGILGGVSEGSSTLPVETVEGGGKSSKNPDESTENSTQTTEEVDNTSKDNNEEVESTTEEANNSEDEGEGEVSNEKSKKKASDDFADDDELDQRLGKEKKKEEKVQEEASKQKAKETLPKDKPIVTTKQPVVARDLEGFDDEEKVLLTRMSNEAFNKFAPIIKEAKNFKVEKEKLVQEIEIAKKTIPAKSYYNKFGYAEDEEFINTQQAATTSQIYSQFFKQQRINMLTTGKCYELKGLTENGQPILGNIVEAADEAAKIQYAATIEDIIRQQEVLTAQNMSRADNIRTEWAKKAENASAMLEIQEKKWFPQLSAAGEKNEFVKTMMDTLRSEGHGQNPLAKMLSYLYATLMESAKVANKKLEEHNKATTAETIKAKAGPSSRSIATATVTNRNSNGKPALVASDDEFDSRLRSE